MSAELETGRRIEDLTTVGLSRERAERLKEIRDDHDLRSVNAAIAVTISAYDQLAGLQIPEKARQ